MQDQYKLKVLDVHKHILLVECTLSLLNGKTCSANWSVLGSDNYNFSHGIYCKVQQDIHHAFRESGGDVKNLPILPKSVGGEFYLMIGIKCLRYHHNIVFKLPSGVAIYRSMFRNAD